MRESLASRIRRILAPLPPEPSSVAGGKRATVIAVSNQKGGVGKTTTAVNLGAGLALFHRQKVLLVDLDAQGHVSISLRRPFAENGSGIGAVLSARHGSLLETVAATDLENLDMTLSDRSLLDAEDQIAGKIGREFLLRKSLEPAKGHYDFILLDCPPNLGLLTINAYVASDFLLVPCELSALALEGLEGLLEAVETVRHRLRHPLEILGILPTRVDHRNLTMNEAAFERLQEVFGDRVFQTRITVNTDLNKAQMAGIPIFRFAPSSTGASNYRALADETIERTRWFRTSERTASA